MKMINTIKKSDIVVLMLEVNLKPKVKSKHSVFLCCFCSFCGVTTLGQIALPSRTFTRLLY
jgi:hypothetical protein